jgi:predicted dehydrogenase
MHKPLRIALVGAGHMGKFHAQAIAERTDARLVAVCDVDEARAAALAGPAGARVETDVRRLAGHVDAAVIAAATSAHLALAVPLMEAGVAVLIEKPVAPTAGEARRIADAARRSGAVAQVGHILRFDPVTRAIAGLDLKPRFLDVSWMAPFSFRSMDVGAVMDLMVHGLDVVLYLAREMPARVDATGGVVIGPHEDFASARLEFPSGCVAMLTVSRMSRTRQRVVRVFSEGTYLKLDYDPRGAAARRRLGRPRDRRETARGGPAGCPAGPVGEFPRRRSRQAPAGRYAGRRSEGGGGGGEGHPCCCKSGVNSLR